MDSLGWPQQSHREAYVGAGVRSPRIVDAAIGSTGLMPGSAHEENENDVTLAVTSDDQALIYLPRSLGDSRRENQRAPESAPPITGSVTVVC